MEFTFLEICVVLVAIIRAIVVIQLREEYNRKLSRWLRFSKPLTIEMRPDLIKISIDIQLTFSDDTDWQHSVDSWSRVD